MSIEERAKIFGDPSGSLVPEAVWLFHEDHEYWPAWEEALDLLVSWTEIERDEAENRLNEAVKNGDVLAKLGDEEQSWYLTLNETTYDAITRRYLEMTLKRLAPEENF